MINIPDEIFVGKSKELEDKLSYATIVPVGTYAAEKQKMNKVAKNYATTIIEKNVALPGFTLVHHSNTWSNSNRETSWVVIDPRGFIMHISSANLSQILACAGITEGLIQEKCVWAREGGANVLLPVNSAPYALAKVNTAVISKRITLRDVKVGDTVKLHNKTEGVYLGLFKIVPQTSSYSSAFVAKLNDLKKTYILRMKDATDTTFYYMSSNIKVSEILEHNTSMTEDRAEDEVLNAMYDPAGINLVRNDYGFDVAGKMIKVSPPTNRDLPHVLTKQTGSPIIALQEITVSDFKKKLNHAKKFNIPNTLIGRRDNKYYAFAGIYQGIDSWKEISKMAPDGNIEFAQRKSVSSGYWNRERMEIITLPLKVSDFDTVYILRATIGTKTYDIQ